MRNTYKACLFLIGVVLASTGFAQGWCFITAGNTTGTNLPRVLLIGDSITMRYSSQVTAALKDKAYVSVLTTGRAVGDPILLEEITLALSQHKCALVHFNNGLHSGQDYAIYRKGFPEFLDTLKRNARGATLVWGTTTALAGWGKQVPELNRIAAECIAGQDIRVDDLYGLMASNTNFNWWDGGGTHASAEGQARHAKQVAQSILSNLPARPPGGWTDDPYPFKRRDAFEWCHISTPDGRQTTLPRVLILGDAPPAELTTLMKNKAQQTVLFTSKSMGDPALLSELKLVLKQGPYAVILINNGLHSGAGYTLDEYRKGLPQVMDELKKSASGAVLVWATASPCRGEWMIKNDREFVKIAAGYVAEQGGLVKDLQIVSGSADEAQVRKAQEGIAAARKAAGDTEHGRSIDLAVDYVQCLAAIRARVVQGGKSVPEAVAVERNGVDLILDGRLDEAFWLGVPEFDLKAVVTGEPPVAKGRFKAVWNGQYIVLGIRCEEPDKQGPNITSRENEDPAIWDGDNIELLIETQAHSYYQITIGPSGAVMDLDRKRGGLNSTWSSDVEVKAHAGDGFWSMEMRLPVNGPDVEASNPLHGLAGSKPTRDAPWYFNLYRNRVSGNAVEGSVFAPLKKGNLHAPSTFGRLIVK